MMMHTENKQTGYAKQQRTGYPSKDRPWLKYYSEEMIHAPLPECTVYEYILHCNKDNLERTAINYYGTLIKYKDLFQKIDRVASALESIGIQEGDIVTLCMINSPETIFLMFALNKIGAAGNMIHMSDSPAAVKQHMLDTNAKYIFTLDIFQSKVLKVIEGLPIERVIVSTTIQSMSFLNRLGAKVSKKAKKIPLPQDNRFIPWNRFVCLGHSNAKTTHDTNATAFITYTGGTTGGSKGVLLSNKAVVVSAKAGVDQADVIYRDSTCLEAMPLFIAYGVSCLLIPLVAGMTLLLRIPMAESIAELAYRCKHGRSLQAKALDAKAMLWADLMKKASASRTALPPAPYEKDRPAIIPHTGGTSGDPKGAVLTNDAMNAVVLQLSLSDVTLAAQHSMLDIMPLFSCYGMLCGLHGPLCMRMEVILIPKFQAEDFPSLIAKHRPNHVMGVPAFWEDLAKSWTGGSLSFLYDPAAGGDTMKAETEARVNAFFARNGCKVKMVKGYGLTEVCSGVTYPTCDACNKIGSVGIPLVKNVIKIVEPDTLKELPYNTLGEICITGPSLMLGYYKNEQETREVLRHHADGLLWFHSGDMGMMDEDGVLFVKDRLKRVIFAANGHTIYPSQSEDIIMKNPWVEACAVVGVKDPARENGIIPTAFVVVQNDLESQHDQMEEALRTACKTYLPECDCPYAYVFIDRLPLTPLAKVDYRALAKMAEAKA